MGEDAVTIMRWFGFEKTGRTIAPHGTPIPEYALVDEQQMKRAIADPYGYRVQDAIDAAIPSSWSSVKVLFQ